MNPKDITDIFLPKDADKTADSFSAQDAHENESGSLNLMLFSVGGVSFGVDAEQITEINTYNEENAGELCWFHKEIGYDNKTIHYHSPTVISIKTDVSLPYRVIIDLMEDITEVSLNELTPFPALLEPLLLPKGLWGILPRNGSMILLLDFMRLLNERKLNERNTH